MNFHVKNSKQSGAEISAARVPTSQGKSLPSFLASLSVAGGIFAIEIILFLILRIKMPQI